MGTLDLTIKNNEKATKTRVPIRDVSPFLGDNSELECGERQHNDCVHSLFSLRGLPRGH